MGEAESDLTIGKIGGDCTGPLHPQALRGIELFNRGEYFEAHEMLEMAWRAETGPIRDLYRGILQVGVAYYHIRRGNYPGARKLFQRARRWLAPWPAECRGVQVERLRQDAVRVERKLIEAGPERMNAIQPMHFEPVYINQ